MLEWIKHTVEKHLPEETKLAKYLADMLNLSKYGFKAEKDITVRMTGTDGRNTEISLSGNEIEEPQPTMGGDFKLTVPLMVDDIVKCIPAAGRSRI